MQDESQGLSQFTEGRHIPPGSITIRPTRTDAEEDPNDFCKLLKSIKETQGLTHENIAKIIEYESDNPAANIVKKISHANFSKGEKDRFLSHVFTHEKFFSRQAKNKLTGIPDAFHFAFLNEFKTQETSQDNARAQIVGTYKLFRFSVEHDDEFVFGKLVFSEDAKSHAVRVTMLQPKRSTEGLRETVEEATGYFFRVSQMYLIILRDVLTNDFRATLFPRFKFDYVGTDVHPRSVFSGRRKHLVHLDGFGLGIDGSAGFFSPVHLSLVDDADELARLDDQLDVLAENDDRIPRRIKKKLLRNGPLRRL